MRYAVISDIHANMPALTAVLEDIKNQSVDEFIFAGDYLIDLPYFNEVVDTIRNLRNAHVVSGNKERHFESLTEQDQSKWTDAQFSATYYNYKNITKENMEYLCTLPDVISTNGIYVSHTLFDNYAKTSLRRLSSRQFKNKMDEQPFTHKEFLDYTKTLLNNDDVLLNYLFNNIHKVFIFGHSHIQWHARVGDKLLLNPGSCGFSLDFDNSAAYSILDYNGKDWEVAERRVPYNVNNVIKHTRQSELYKTAKIWCELIFRELIESKEILSLFFEHAERIAAYKNDSRRPFSDEIWTAAYEELISDL